MFWIWILSCFSLTLTIGFELVDFTIWYGLCSLLMAVQWTTVINFQVMLSLLDRCFIRNHTTSSYFYWKIWMKENDVLKHILNHSLDSYAICIKWGHLEFLVVSWFLCDIGFWFALDLHVNFRSDVLLGKNVIASAI